LLAYHVERITVEGTAILIRSVFQMRQFDAAAVDKLIWKTRPRGSRIDFFVAGRRTSVDLDGYDDEDRLRMIRRFRGLIPAAKQADWPMFCQKIALPLRDRCARPAAGEPPCPRAEGEVVITRRRYDRLAAVMLPASFVVAGAVWWATGSPVLLGAALAIAAGWLFLRYTVRREGERRVQLTAMPGHRSLLSYLAVTVGSAIFISVLRLAGVGRDAALSAGLMVLVPAMPFLVYGLFRAAKQQDHEAEIGATTAPDRWESGELAGPQTACGKSTELATH
jgi:hypothetical protein